MLMDVSNGPVAVAYVAADTKTMPLSKWHGLGVSCHVRIVKLTIRTFLDRMINGLS